MQTLEDFRGEARRWLAQRWPERAGDGADEADEWGAGSDSVAIFQNLTPDQEAELVAAASKWQAEKFDAGYGALTWPERYGGRGLPRSYAHAFASEEARFATPTTTELFGVTVELIAPTISVHGTEEQKDRFIRPLLRTDLLACQLFSEPGAGSDLASLSTRAVRDGDDWVITGQKVWTSGAHLAQYGECICRTDPTAPKHQGLTAFLVPLDAPGMTVRPIRQMSGGAAFNEVFLDEVRVPDTLRLGDPGQGWAVTLTTLAHERGGGGSVAVVPNTFRRVLQLARHLGVTGDPCVRRDLADLYIDSRVRAMTGQRIQAQRRAGQPPGPEGSIGKLSWTESLGQTSRVVAGLLGARLTADTGEWGTFAWGEYVCGAPGYRIAGGSDEIQRNIIAERVLGLPREPKGNG